MSGKSDIKYSHVKEERYVNQADLMGKTFLVSDSLKKREWKLIKEIKNIGKYTCFKAVSEEEVIERSITPNGEVIKEKKMKTTTVWYTLDIPVKHGPDNYWGLPGLVMEVQDGKFSLMCTKVVLNPSEEVRIEAPVRGKAVSAQEYYKISEEKIKEGAERYSGGSKKGENSSFSIRIGG
jgi:GLPGLI family protein